jgi:pimeloyl-ACP methyl ester carboxylesterase
MAEIFRSATPIEGFAQPEMAFQFLRALSVVFAGGGALGECLAVRGQVEDGDAGGWVKGFTAMADRLAAEAGAAMAAGHEVSARDLLLRASMYYRSAEYFEDIADENHRTLGLASAECFRSAAPLMTPYVEPVDIPFEGLTLPGYFVCPSGRPKGTLLIYGGFDSSAEELILAHGLGAVERGFSVLAFDGPGQTGLMRTHPGLTLRPDTEAVLAAVADAVVHLLGADPSRLALLGLSLGGHFALRAAVHEPRFAALILNTPILDIFSYTAAFFPPGTTDGPDFGPDEVRAMPDEALPSPLRRNLLQLFRRYCGPDGRSFKALLEALARFRLEPEDIAAVTCPALACLGAGEGAEPRRQWEAFAKASGGPVTSHVFDADWGAESHCQVGNLQRFAQVAFDWLAEVLA